LTVGPQPHSKLQIKAVTESKSSKGTKQHAALSLLQVKYLQKSEVFNSSLVGDTVAKVCSFGFYLTELVCIEV